MFTNIFGFKHFRCQVSFHMVIIVGFVQHQLAISTVNTPLYDVALVLQSQTGHEVYTVPRSLSALAKLS